MRGAGNLVVDVALEKIGEEAQAHYLGEAASRFAQQFPLGRDEEGASLREVALQEGLEEYAAEADERKIGLVFRRRRRDRPHEIPEVEEDGARHHRVEIDDAQRFGAVVVEEDVVKFRVVVAGARRKEPRPRRSGEGAAAVPCSPP